MAVILMNLKNSLSNFEWTKGLLFLNELDNTAMEQKLCIKKEKRLSNIKLKKYLMK